MLLRNHLVLSPFNAMQCQWFITMIGLTNPLAGALRARTRKMVFRAGRWGRGVALGWECVLGPDVHIY